MRGRTSPISSCIPDSLIAGVELSQRLKRSVDATLDVTGGFEWLDQRTRIFQAGTAVPFTRDHLRVLFARLDDQSSFRNGAGDLIAQVDAHVELRKGLEIFDASRLGHAEVAAMRRAVSMAIRRRSSCAAS